MPIELVLLLLAMAIATLVTLVGVILVAWLEWRRTADGFAPVPIQVGSEPGASTSSMGSLTATEATAPDSSRPDMADRVVRVLAFLFLAVVGVFVAVTNAFPATAVAIELLLAAGILFVVFMQDLLPARALRRSRYLIEAVVAIAFMAVLVGLSGGLASPFLPGFFLIVAGASLAIESPASILLAVLAGLAYGLVGLLVAGPTASTPTALAWLSFNLMALALLAYLGTVAGREQRRARDAAVRLSHFDPLTGLYNRTFFFSVMDREIRRAARTARGFSVLMLDIDDLKPVNDTFGHQYGDRLLRAVTDVVQRNVRGTDMAARYGGDEFVVLLTDTDPSGAYVVAEKLRSDIANLALRVDERTVRTSVSIGLVAYGEDGTTIETLIGSADAAMYESKRRGKNQIVGYATRTERVATAIGPSSGRPMGPVPSEAAEWLAGSAHRPILAAVPHAESGEGATSPRRRTSLYAAAGRGSGAARQPGTDPGFDRSSQVRVPTASGSAQPASRGRIGPPLPPVRVASRSYVALDVGTAGRPRPIQDGGIASEA